jgi:hypothetical protein
MVVPPYTGASRYHKCCIDGGTSPEDFGFTVVLCELPVLVLKLIISPPPPLPDCTVEWYFEGINPRNALRHMHM